MHFELGLPTASPVPLVVHVPHSSTHVPAAYLADFAIGGSELATELRLMTDHFTDELAEATTALGGTTFVNRVSRLVMDPERFAEDADEPMAKRGMGAVYANRQDGSPLRRTGFSAAERSRVIDALYVPYHARLEALVGGLLENHGACVLVDLHSFPRRPLPYEDGSLARPSICIGFDEFHVDEVRRDQWAAQIRERGLDVSFNAPFSGSLVPARFYRREPRVRALMIEVRRDLYMEETTGEKNADFAAVAALVSSLLASPAERASRYSGC
ncbi:MAG TPA: N-formylglutamate amidohydrolase [Polyangiaceae bacterium]